MQMEPGQDIADLVLPSEFFFVDQDAERCAGKRLAVGSNRKQGTIVDLAGLVDLPYAIALCVEKIVGFPAWPGISQLSHPKTEVS